MSVRIRVLMDGWMGLYIAIDHIVGPVVLKFGIYVLMPVLPFIYPVIEIFNDLFITNVLCNINFFKSYLFWKSYKLHNVSQTPLHSFNTRFQASIIGAKTKKILFIGVRNSYCCICARAESKNKPADEHTCYKNWSKSATAMEADIIVDGFKKSVQMYNIKYVNIIGK